MSSIRAVLYAVLAFAALTSVTAMDSDADDLDFVVRLLQSNSNSTTTTTSSSTTTTTTTTTKAGGSNATTTAAPATTTTTAAPTVVKGSVAASVPNCANFIASTAAKGAFDAALKKTFSITATMTLTTTYTCPTSGGRRLREESRRLADTLNVAYTISIPAAEASKSASIETAIKATTKEALTTAVTTELNAAKLSANDFGVTVTTIAAPTVQAPAGATTTAATTTATLASGQSGATRGAKLEMLLVAAPMAFMSTLMLL